MNIEFISILNWFGSIWFGLKNWFRTGVIRSIWIWFGFSFGLVQKFGLELGLVFIRLVRIWFDSNWCVGFKIWFGY